jgi:hypothetical protein
MSWINHECEPTIWSMQEILDALRSFQSRLLLALHGIPEADLRRPEPDGRWSAADVVAHFGQIELVTALRIRTMLAHEPNSPLAPLDQDRWIANVPHDEPLAELFEQFWFQRRHNTALIARLNDEQLSRAGIHPVHGRITIREVVERLRRHDDKHLTQIERIKAKLGLTAAATPDVSGVVAGRANGDSQSPGEGVRIRTLWSDGLRRALEVELDRGAQWPGIDYHVPGPEEVYVLDGDFDDGARVHAAGTFLHHPAGSSHSPRSESGCRLLVFYPEG